MTIFPPNKGADALAKLGAPASLGDYNSMTKKEALDLLRDVRADYVATMRECDRLRKRYLLNPDPFKYDNLPLLKRLDKGIKDLEMATV